MAQGTHDSSAASSGVRLASGKGTSLHRQIFLVLRERIRTGVYAAGESLPSEDALSRLFRVSRVTLRAALANLEADGLIERRQGIGTFVVEGNDQPAIHAPMSDLLAHIADVGRTTSVKLLELDLVKAPGAVHAQFGAESGGMFQRAVRLRSMHKIPVFYVVTYIPQSIAKHFSRKQMSGPSLLQLLRTRGVNFKSGKQVVSAALADPTVAAALDVEVGAPLVQIRRIHFDEQSRPFEYMEMLASPSRFELHMTLSQDDMPK
jgi:GntR family transcriptional regulator